MADSQADVAESQDVTAKLVEDFAALDLQKPDKPLAVPSSNHWVLLWRFIEQNGLRGQNENYVAPRNGITHGMEEKDIGNLVDLLDKFLPPDDAARQLTVLELQTALELDKNQVAAIVFAHVLTVVRESFYEAKIDKNNALKTELDKVLTARKCEPTLLFDELNLTEAKKINQMRNIIHTGKTLPNAFRAKLSKDWFNGEVELLTVDACCRRIRDCLSERDWNWFNSELAKKPPPSNLGQLLHILNSSKLKARTYRSVKQVADSILEMAKNKPALLQIPDLFLSVLHTIPYRKSNYRAFSDIPDFAAKEQSEVDAFSWAISVLQLYIGFDPSSE